MPAGAMPSQRGPGRPPNNSIRASPRNKKSKSKPAKAKGKGKPQSAGDSNRERGTRPAQGCCCVCRGQDGEEMHNPMLKCAGVSSICITLLALCLAITCTLPCDAAAWDIIAVQWRAELWLLDLQNFCRGSSQRFVVICCLPMYTHAITPGCNGCVHALCSGDFTHKPTEKNCKGWMCAPCYQGVPSNVPTVCAVCNRDSSWGMMKETTRGNWAHLICSLALPDVTCLKMGGYVCA
jgi:hypothetical protein